jgi:hypothetical protein
MPKYLLRLMEKIFKQQQQQQQHHQQQQLTVSPLAKVGAPQPCTSIPSQRGPCSESSSQPPKDVAAAAAVWEENRQNSILLHYHNYTI